MKKLFVTLTAVAIAATAANATCWRINPSPYAGAQFLTVDDAMNDINVLAGDTLLLDAGKHGAVSLKRNDLTVIGTGYYLDQNKKWAESQATIVTVANLTKGSKIEGCTATEFIYSAEESTISRCNTPRIQFNGKNAIVEDCIINYLEINSDNAIIRNNIITQYAVASRDGILFENNTVVGTGRSGYDHPLIQNFTNSTIRNNILINTSAGFDSNQTPYSTHIFYNCTNCVIQNNVLSTPERYADASYPNNIYAGATVGTMFINEGADDAKWQLLDNCAARNAATHGGDCGAFGGATPYVLSGIPMFLPHITEALVPARPTDGKITVRLKIETQNE